MTGLGLGRLTALMALLGLFAMHGFTAGHDSGHCLAPDGAAHAHHAADRAPERPGDARATAAGDSSAAAAKFATDPGGPAARESGCGLLGVSGTCLAVLLGFLLLALLRAAWRRWCPARLLPAVPGRTVPVPRERAGGIRGPSLAQLCVLRT